MKFKSPLAKILSMRKLKEVSEAPTMKKKSFPVHKMSFPTPRMK